MTPLDSQVFESYVPVYDAIPEKWEDARAFIVEQMKKMSIAINTREIGWFLDEELLSGKAFIPGSTALSEIGTSQVFRSVLRKVVDVGPLAAGINAGVLHGIVFDNNFTLVDIWVAATNSSTFLALDISGNDVIMNATDIVITSPGVFDRAFCVIEYMQEL